MGNVLQNNDSNSELNPDEVKKNIVEKFKSHIPETIFSLLIGVPTFSIMLNHVFETLGGAVESMEIPFIGFIVAYSVLPFLVTWLWILFYDKQKDAISKKIGFVAIALPIAICVVLLFTMFPITDMANKYKNVKAHREIVVKAEKKRDSTEYWYYRGLMGGKTIDSIDRTIKADLKLGDSIGSKNSSMDIYKEATADAQRTIIASKVVENGFAVSAVEVVATMRWIIGAAFVLSFSALLYWRKKLKEIRKNTIVTNALMSNMAGLFTLVFLILALFPKIEAKDIKTDKPLWFLFIPSWYALESPILKAPFSQQENNTIDYMALLQDIHQGVKDANNELQVSKENIETIGENVEAGNFFLSVMSKIDNRYLITNTSIKKPVILKDKKDKKGENNEKDEYSNQIPFVNHVDKNKLHEAHKQLYKKIREAIKNRKEKK